MKDWLKKYRWNVIVSTAVTMLPVLIGLLLWEKLPDVIASHWGGDGVADGFSSKAFVVFAMPAIMAALNLLCVVVTALDPKQANQSKKAMSIVFWIIPMLSLGIMGITYGIAMGKAVDAFVLMPLLLGVMFVSIGNYMPKVTQNRRLGIKIFWTLHNEENWNRTHRFAGKIWVVGGVLVMLAALLPSKWMICVVTPVMLLEIVAPMAYSYFIYRKHKAQGIRYDAPPAGKQEKNARRMSSVTVAVIVVLVGILLFTGNITYTCGEDALHIESTYSGGLALSYGDIDSIELRDDFSVGVRAMGFASPRLSTGTYQNEELESYTLYSYNSCQSMILIHSDGKALAFNCQTQEETTALYQAIVEKMG